MCAPVLGPEVWRANVAIPGPASSSTAVGSVGSLSVPGGGAVNPGGLGGSGAVNVVAIFNSFRSFRSFR